MQHWIHCCGGALGAMEFCVAICNMHHCSNLLQLHWWAPPHSHDPFTHHHHTITPFPMIAGIPASATWCALLLLITPPFPHPLIQQRTSSYHPPWLTIIIIPLRMVVCHPITKYETENGYWPPHYYTETELRIDMPTANNFMTLRIIVFMQATESECGPHNVTENGCCHPPQQPVTLRISANNPTTTTQRMVGVDHPITQKMGVES
jgi:hypothetical protein